MAIYIEYDLRNRTKALTFFSSNNLIFNKVIFNNVFNNLKIVYDTRAANYPYF